MTDGGFNRSAAVLAALLIASAIGIASPPPGAQPEGRQQQRQEQQPPQPVFRAEANYVRVDVYPTLQGRPVTDLARDDFEILEDGRPQKIEAFEHVVIRPAGPQDSRIEPNNVEASRQAAADPRARVFVLFLDTYHVGNEGSHRIRAPLIRLLNRAIGADDLVGVMTPEMSAANLTLARKTTTIEGFLTKDWTWGRRFDITFVDPIEDKYRSCFPGEISQEMILRRREKLTLDALQDLVRHLHGIREERKAILTVTEGWVQYRQHVNLARPIANYPLPGTPEVGVSSDGKLGTGSRNVHQTSLYECERDRQQLAMLDNERLFRDILQEANRANASFYPVDPRGLPVFDTPIGPDKPPPLPVDRAQLRERLTSLRTMAENTDGMAVLDNNDIESGLKRIADDLTSYYLLGYYSTNSKPDGRYRSITVKVKRPGVDVRARRGYRAATEEEIASRTVSAETPVSGDARALDAALGRLAGARAEARFRVHAGNIGAASETARPDAIWVVGELDYTTSRDVDWRAGSTAAIVVTRGGETVATAEARLEPGARTFFAAIPASSLGAGDYSVQVRLKSPVSPLPLTDGARFDVGDPAPPIGAPVLLRRGPATGNRFEPTADLRFRRTETLRVRVPVRGGTSQAAWRLLDRNGGEMQVPVGAVADGAGDPAGERGWPAGELSLAPLAAGDYVIEVSVAVGSERHKALAPFRVIR
jgi:VWFA-related protein